MVNLCPRCGEKISWLEKRKTKNNTYVYAVHETRENGKRKVMKCYLGPENGYNYVSHLHEGLVLRGLTDRNRELEYLEELLEYLKRRIEEEELDKERAKELAKRLEEITQMLRKYSEEGP